MYFKNLKKYKPEFTTYFTNHLAGMMHYYWLDIFPKDFQKAYRYPSFFNKRSVIKALDLADKQIGLLMRFAEDNSYQFWVASSMGQQAIEREKNQNLYLRDFSKLIKILKLDSKKFNHLPSMYPDINIEGSSAEDLEILIKKFIQIKFSNNKSIFKIRYRKSPKKSQLNFN